VVGLALVLAIACAATAWGTGPAAAASAERLAQPRAEAPPIQPPSLLKAETARLRTLETRLARLKADIDDVARKLGYSVLFGDAPPAPRAVIVEMIARESRMISDDARALARSVSRLADPQARRIAADAERIAREARRLGRFAMGEEAEPSFDMPPPAAGTPETATEERATAARPAGAVRASRLFTGPDAYPPDAFAAYGILAFRARATDADRARHEMICNAYGAVLPATHELAVPRAEQMVTVWPVTSDARAASLNAAPIETACPEAVANYDLVTARTAIREAEAVTEIEGIGPFLLAWSPATAKGRTDVPVLVMDLSEVETYARAQTVFIAWARDIETEPELWRRGWNLERLRRTIRDWADTYGEHLLLLLG
jgi:hypothetical protein